jgi:hypothetical protein
MASPAAIKQQQDALLLSLAEALARYADVS